MAMVTIGAEVVRTGSADAAVEKLRAMLERYHGRQARRAGWVRRVVPTGLAPLDAALPFGGLPCGAVTEILADGPGVGSLSLALRIAGRCIGVGRHTLLSPPPDESGKERTPLNPPFARGEAPPLSPPLVRGEIASGAWPEDHRNIVVVDMLQDFYPPAAWQHGIALDRLIVLRTGSARDAFWAVDQSLRCPAVAVVIALLTQLDERGSRRLQLAAESSGCLGLILRSARRRVRSFAAVRMLLEGPSASPLSEEGRAYAVDPYLCRITLLTVREGMPAGPLWVDLHHETGTWPLHPVPVDRSTAQAG